jgi:hypothetical protein
VGVCARHRISGDGVSALDPEEPERFEDIFDDPRVQAILDAIADDRHVDFSQVRRESGLSESVIQQLEVILQVRAVHDAGDDRLATQSLGEAMAAAASRVPLDLSQGVRWGPLLIFEAVGSGAFGDVYRAWDPALEHEVALKRIGVSPGSGIRRAVPDGRLLAKVRHPNVIAVHGACEVGDEVGVWMDFVHGRTLEQIVRREGPLSGPEARVVGETLSDALAAAHRAGVLHRDIKAANVMRETGGRLVLVDFGTGGEIELDDGSRDVNMAGTPLYMAPELFEGKGASVRSDVYSLGVLLFFLVTGDFPVRAKTVDGIRKAHAARRRVLLADVRPGLPKAFVRVVERATAHAPADRFASAGEMLAALAAEATPGFSHPWSAVAAATVGGVVLVPFLLGQLATAPYNEVFGRVGDFADESLIETWTIGRRMLLMPVVYVLLTYLVWRVVTGMCRWMAARPLVRRQSMAQSVGRSCGRIAQAVGGRDARAMSDRLLAVQVVVIVLVCWAFREVISTSIMATLAHSEPEAFTPLQLGVLSTHAYRYVLTVAAFVMVVTWLRVLRHQSRDTRVGTMNIVAGFTLVGLVLALLVIPYRIIWQNEAERAELSGQRCYVIGSAPRAAPQRYLLYCPDATRPKVRIVPATDPGLKRLDYSENIFKKPA